MSKIDLGTKFFHGVGWNETDEIRLKNLEKILGDGKILSAKDVTLKNGSVPSSELDKVFLSVHPYGIYSRKFVGDRQPKGYTGFDMTTSSFYFILNNQLIKNLRVESGSYPLECTTDEAIDLKKYLVGVGNAGYEISPQLIMCYYYTMYIKGGISQKEMLVKMRNCLIPGKDYLRYQNDHFIFEQIYSWTHLNGHFYGDTAYNRVVDTVYKQSSESFVAPRYYNPIKEMFEKHSFYTEYYDFEGYSIEPEKRLVKASKMHEYIRKNAPYYKK